MSLNDLLLEFCGGEIFLNESFLSQETPELTSCFLDTVPTWAACGFLWIAALPFIIYAHVYRKEPLPFSYLHITKTALCIGLACLAELQFTFRQMHGSQCNGLEDTTQAAQIAMLVKIATFLLAAALLQAQKRYGRIRSGVLFSFWPIMLVAEVFQMYTYVTDEEQCGTHWIFYAYFGLLGLQFLAHCWVMPGQKATEDKIPCPVDGSSTLSRLTFSWFSGLIYGVVRNKFSRDTMWNQSEELKSNYVGERLDKAWLKYENKQRGKRIAKRKMSSSDSEKTPLLSNDEMNQRRNNTKSMTKGALAVVVLREFWFEILEFLFYSWFSIGAYFTLPILLRYLIDYIDNKDQGEQPLWVGVALTISMFLTMEASSVFYHCLLHYTNVTGLKFKSALMYVIYKKALIVSKSENRISVGDVVSLMSVDCQRIQDAIFQSYYVPDCILFVVIAWFMLVDIVGVLATLGGMLFLFATVPINWYIATLQTKLQKEAMYLKALRLRLMNEILAGIKVLKMYAWEYTFIQKIHDIRNKEVEKMRRNAILIAIATSIGNHSQYMIHFIIILIYIFTVSGLHLSSSVAFVTFSIVVVLKYAVSSMPTVINRMAQCWVSIGRIEEFLRSSNLDELILTPTRTLSDYAVKVEDGSFTWDKTDKTPCLSGIDLKIRPGQLIAVVGPCGSGKSSLISAILGEMRKLSGSVEIKGSLAYVPQEAWLQNMTLRDNILFGKEYNSTKYWKTVQNCALKSDLAILDGGDKTEIGEKGTNVSGGQKQRISLARAVYSNADVFLLDDPLSAVDARVGKDLFKNVISHSGQLRNKTRILVTHAIHWLPLVDKVVVMNNGVVSECGTYDELMTHNGAFAQFLLQYLSTESQEDLDDPEIRWIRDNMLEQVESVTSEGGDGNSSDNQSRLGNRRTKKKKLKRRQLANASMSQSVTKTTSTHMTLTQYDIKRLTTEEAIGEGAVKLSVFIDYVKAMGPLPALLSIIGIFFYYGLNVFSMFWLTFWTEDVYLKNTSNTNESEYSNLTYQYLIWYAVMGLLQGVALYLSFHLSLTKLIHASSVLHSNMLKSIMRSPMSFFDTVPKGRILNRFSSDIDIMDNKIPDTYCVYITMVMSTVSSLVVMVANTPIFLAILVPTMAICVALMKIYLPTIRKMRRIESVTRSPIYNHFSETLSGSSVIRAHKSTQRFIDEAKDRIDENLKYYFAANTGARWLGVRLDFLANIIVLTITLIVINSDILNGSQLGLSINYAVQIGFTLNSVVWSIQDMEMNAVSAERVNEYTVLEPEADWDEGMITPALEWPTKGEILFRNYTTRYRVGLDLVLKGINASFKHGEKIGVVGRTGAGKSSLTLALFRIVESVGGAIIIDGVNIADLGLHQLRSKFAILPQDPVLFTGTLRMNVDPLGKWSDDEIWRALESAHLKHFAKTHTGQLDYDCGEAGQNLSVGQRQLVCLARTLLNKTNILILDEATAAVDMETDNLIQQTIRSRFHDCTIITIAHRLNTIMDYNRVIVLDQGLIKEFGNPRELLKDKDGIFYSMAKDAELI